VKWRGRRESGNVEDRRGIGGRGLAIGGGGGIVTIIVILLVVLLGGNPSAVINPNQPVASTLAPGATTGNTREDELKSFTLVVLADTEDMWTEQFRLMGETYVKPTLVLYSGYVETPGGVASSATGPFYSPQDQKVYLDLSFFQELKDRFQASGDFADAYVIAHEVGHHVQKLLGIMDEVDAAQARASETQKNALSVRLELQADFLAGVWAHYEQTTLGVIQPGDIGEALAAASAIGDDRIQKQVQGYAVPDTFTHGTSEQRVRWFKLGYETGDLSKGDTFSADPL
jgi:predicted metalloprotease